LPITYANEHRQTVAPPARGCARSDLPSPCGCSRAWLHPGLMTLACTFAAAVPCRKCTPRESRHPRRGSTSRWSRLQSLRHEAQPPCARASACRDRSQALPYDLTAGRREDSPRRAVRGRGPQYENRLPDPKTREWLLHVCGQSAKAPVRSVSGGKRKPCGSNAPHARVIDKAEKDRSDRRDL